MVEWKKMWEVTTWDKKFQGVEISMQSIIISYPYLLAKDLFALSHQNGDVKILSTGVQEGWTTEELAGDYLCEGEVVTIPWGKSPGAKNPVKYYKGKFVTGDNRIATSSNTSVLNNKYLYYWMYTKSDLIETYYRGAGIQHPSMYKVLTMPVPIPPLSEQSRIVGILDTFTASIENLKQQIAERRKQFEYYRDILFDLEGIKIVETKKLSDEIISLKTGLNPRKNFKLNSPGCDIPYITGKDIYNNRINVTNITDKIDKTALKLINKRACLESGLILFASTGTGTVGRMAIIEDYNNDWGMSETLYGIKVKPNLIPKYVMYCLYSNQIRKQYEPKISKGSVPHLKVVDLLNVVIPHPLKEEQSRIVSILDTFEASIANLEAQLKQREKQYEYYRNKLLTFE